MQLDQAMSTKKRKQKADPSLRAVVMPYQRPALWRSLMQVADSIIPYMVLWYLTYLSLSYSYWLTLGLAILAGMFLVRIFIILHDCGHGSFFASQKWNNILGAITGVLTFTAYFRWRQEHAIHHASSGDLDRRGAGDVYTATVEEYLGWGRKERFLYCTFRHPVLLMLFGPIWSFVIVQRIPGSYGGKRERQSVIWTNIALLAIIAAFSLTIGLGTYLMIQGPIVIAAGMMAIWLFYCQHQFEETYWRRHEEWDFEAAALEGSSYFRMPKLMQWFTGNIGFHHVHHLNPRVPNYYLEACHKAHPRFQEAPVVTFWDSRRFFALKVWDEESQRLIGIKEIGVIEERNRQRATHQAVGGKAIAEPAE